MQIMIKHKQLTEPLRYQLYALNKSTMSQTKITKQLGVHQSTISRKLKRKIDKRGYRAIQANNNAIKRRARAVSCPVMIPDEIERITVKHKEKWRLEQITGD